MFVWTEYEQQDSYIGATVGRNASRIAGSEFELAGTQYRLAANSAGSHLHGGLRGFDKVGDPHIVITYLEMVF